MPWDGSCRSDAIWPKHSPFDNFIAEEFEPPPPFAFGFNPFHNSPALYFVGDPSFFYEDFYDDFYNDYDYDIDDPTLDLDPDAFLRHRQLRRAGGLRRRALRVERRRLSRRRSAIR